MSAPVSMHRVSALGTFITALARAKGDYMQAKTIAAGMRGGTETAELLHAIITRTAIAPGSTSDPTFLGPFAVSTASRELIDLLRPATALTRMAGFRKAPFELPIARETSGTLGNWVGEAHPCPVSAPRYDTLVSLAPLKVQSATIVSVELARSSHPSAQAAIQGDVVKATALTIDQSFLAPTSAAVAGVRPASITFAAPKIASSGGTAANYAADFAKMLGTMADNGGLFLSPYFICAPRLAIKLATLTASSGNLMFPDVTARGGTLFGIPLLTTGACAIDTGDDSYIVLVDTSNIVLCDEGEATLDIAGDASVQMDSAPTDPVDASAVFTSLWQQNLLAIRASRVVNWQPANAAAAVCLTGAPTT